MASRTRTLGLMEAMRFAAAMRQLREVEMEDARRYRDMLAHCTDPRAREFLDGHVRLLVSCARRWNRELLLAGRALRVALYRRQIGRAFMPAAQQPEGVHGT